MGKYSVQNHLPILKKMFSTFSIDSVFEYGMGIHSTTLFVNNCSRIVSIEMNHYSVNNQTWYNKVTNTIGNRENWMHMEMHGPHKAVEYAQNLFKKEKYDLVFADGHGDTRSEQTNSGFGMARFIVCHDAQHRNTINGWKKPKEYYRIDFVNFCRNIGNNTKDDCWATTTVFCKNIEDYKTMKSWLDQEKEVCSLHNFEELV